MKNISIQSTQTLWKIWNVQLSKCLPQLSNEEWVCCLITTLHFVSSSLNTFQAKNHGAY